MTSRRRLSPESMAWGDYDYPDRRITKMHGQNIFYDVIAEHRSVVLEDLARDPLAAFETSPLHTDDFRRLDLRDHLLDPEASKDWYQHDPRCDRLVAALANWGERWQLSASWCQAHALETLHKWAASPEDKGRRWGFGSFNGSGLHAGESRFDMHIQDLGWHPYDTTWEYFEASVMSLVTEYLAQYKEKTERLVEAMGMSRVEPKAKTHLEWLAIYQTSDYGYSTMLAIAHKQQPSLTESGLYQALKSAAQTIDLPLRRSTRKGRKRGIRDRKVRTHIVRQGS